MNNKRYQKQARRAYEEELDELVRVNGGLYVEEARQAKLLADADELIKFADMVIFANEIAMKK